MEKARRVNLLQQLYDYAEEIQKKIHLVCKKGCHCCCTQNVTITSLEADVILGYVQANGRQDLLQEIFCQRKNYCNQKKSPLSTNKYARQCQMETLSEEEYGPENLDPCFFLRDGSCQIYEARPFACRCFVSTQRCDIEATAVLPDWMLTVNTMLLQVIEHIDNGRSWGYMSDVLEYKYFRQDSSCSLASKYLTVAESFPGFMLSPKEYHHVYEMIEKIPQVRFILNTHEN